MSDVRLRAASATDVGRARQINQDCVLLAPDAGLYVVADGMGGHQGGEVAARLAVETLQLAYQDGSADALVEAIAAANQRIRNEGDSDPDLRGMGTTVVALVLLPEGHDLSEDAGPSERLLVANVGDSRAYLFRGGDLVQLTEDHSMVADLVREGRITAEEAENHPQRNIVTRVLGVYESVPVDLWPIDPVQGDRLLLCSDGLFNEVSKDQIAAVLRRLADPEDAAKELVRLANDAGGRDNITVVVVDVEDDGGVAAHASAALAGAASGLAAAPTEDPAGFTTGPPADEDLEAVRKAEASPPKPSRRERRAQRKATRHLRTRFTWRLVLFLLLLAGVVVGALATIQWYGTSTYYVTIEDGFVVIYQGRPGGVLWVEPELVETTDLAAADVPATYLDALEAGREQPSLEDAQGYVANIERDVEEASTPPTTTTTAPTTTTTRPATTTSSTPAP